MPDEGPRVLVSVIGVLVDGVDQMVDAGEARATELLSVNSLNPLLHGD
jgi:hypothetical protein